MSSPVVTALPDETVAAAAGLMSERGVGSIIVVDGKRPLGIVTERDIVRFAAAGPSAEGTKLDALMTAEPDNIGPTSPCRRRWPSSAAMATATSPSSTTAATCSASCRCAT